jgi:hypothetical protein
MSTCPASVDTVNEWVGKQLKKAQVGTEGVVR